MIGILFGRGEWTQAATIAVAEVIMIQIFTLPIMTSGQIYLKTLYASGDVKTPVKIGAATLALSVAFMILLVGQIGYLSVPTGTLIGGAVRNRWLCLACKRRGLYGRDSGTLIATAAFFGLSVAMGAALFFAKPLVTGPLALAAAVFVSAIIYLPIAFLCDKIIPRG
jgi:putative peptidoglycan lipid II flippase